MRDLLWIAAGCVVLLVVSVISWRFLRDAVNPFEPEPFDDSDDFRGEE